MLRALIDQWGINEDEEAEEYQAALAEGRVIHPEHTALWRNSPSEDVMKQFELALQNPETVQNQLEIPLHDLIPDWSGRLGRQWSVHVLNQLAESLDAAIKDGDWDDEIPGLEDVHDYSNPIVLSKKMEKIFYRFAQQYQEQTPINSGDGEADDVAVRQRANQITERHSIRKKRGRLSGRKSSVSIFTH